MDLTIMPPLKNTIQASKGVKLLSRPFQLQPMKHENCQHGKIRIKNTISGTHMLIAMNSYLIGLKAHSTGGNHVWYRKSRQLSRPMKSQIHWHFAEPE